MLNQYKNKLMAGVIVVIVFVVVFNANNTITLTSDNEVAFAQVVSPSPITMPAWTLLDKIAQAKQLLKKSKPLKFDLRKIGKKTTKELVQKQIALAIFNKNTGQVFERRVWVKDQDINNYKKTGFIPLTPDVKAGALNIQVQWWNSFNTAYQIVGHPEMIVLANKYLLPTSAVPYPKERSKTAYSEIIYVPFSDALQQPELVQAGKDQVAKMVDAAYQSLQLRNVQSQSVPGKPVTDVVNKDFVKNIIVVEHVDPDGFAVAGDGGLLLTQRVLAIMGANQDKAYAYTGSPAGASGIAQFIKSTYDMTRKNYPSAGLVPDFSLGMADQENAFKSMVLFFDSHKKAIEDKITRKDVLTQIGGGVTEEMLALAYNGGPSKVIKSVNTYGLAWISGQLNLTVPAIFKRETIGYFNKFEAVKNLNLF